MTKVLRVSPIYKCIGLCDADLLDNGTRHPNLVLMKIAGFLLDNHILFELILDPNADLKRYDYVFMSCVFTFTKLPKFYLDAEGTPNESKFHKGGTGFYANISSISEYRKEREKDFTSLDNNDFLNALDNRRGGMKKKGIDMARQMPYYHLYDDFVERQVKAGFKREKYKDYLQYSIGFLTRGCVRHCPFCVNKLENKVCRYSKLEWFVDNERDEHGRLVRPYIYLWDDNFLASERTVWEPLLQELIDTKRPFQFRQGLDERMLAQSPDGELMAQMLAKSKYHGDFIFAFDNWRDRELIERALKIWKKHNPKKGTKFYLFCGFKLKEQSHKKFYQDIWELFQRIRVLMSYGCVGYVMRHEDYKKYEISNLYIQIARWCNQQQFYKKMSFWEFCYRNQSYWEEKTKGITDRPQLKPFEEFEEDLNNGYYGDGEGQIKMCLTLRTVIRTLNKFPEHRDELLEMFNYKMENLINPQLWQE